MQIRPCLPLLQTCLPWLQTGPCFLLLSSPLLNLQCLPRSSPASLSSHNQPPLVPWVVPWMHPTCTTFPSQELLPTFCLLPTTSHPAVPSSGCVYVPASSGAVSSLGEAQPSLWPQPHAQHRPQLSQQLAATCQTRLQESRVSDLSFPYFFRPACLPPLLFAAGAPYQATRDMA